MLMENGSERVETMRKSTVVHRESWAFPQEERETAMVIADHWRESGRTVTIAEDTLNITIRSARVISYEIDDGERREE